ncbi:AbrB/MazE/SpoVT family DNA-binding domain-containing protein [Methylobacterium platani]|uniref:PbsX family transcriptional regulator n=2 Tax=Methylobacterium platani TaxID=427683 RepID=A0A179SGC2_9HYPH|nr:PbsX family transcriptional regulator [Methylobacterium platani]KMO10306.1 PbsX family transcriptional regulator [Methylobacterium platani JCM 14648]OAS26499.1 PbsX family transcriptional regulator [Methylobacterium platani]
MSIIAKIREQDGARVVTLPSELLESIGAGVGTALALKVKDGAIVAVPIPEPASQRRRRYTMAELLVGAEHLPEIYEGVAGALDGEPAGRELG